MRTLSYYLRSPQSSIILQHPILQHIHPRAFSFNFAIVLSIRFVFFPLEARLILTHSNLPGLPPHCGRKNYVAMTYYYPF